MCKNNNIEEVYIFKKDNKYGIANKKEEIILEPIYYHILDFKEGFARVQKKCDDSKYRYRYNLVDTKGNFISTKWFINASCFSCGLCKVETEEGSMFIKSDGTFLKNYIFYKSSDFINNIAKVQFEEKLEDDFEFIDTNGCKLPFSKYNRIKNDYEPTYVIANKDGKILQIRSSEVCVNSIEDFEKEIIKENLGKTNENSFLRLARKIRKDFGLEKQPKNLSSYK